MQPNANRDSIGQFEHEQEPDERVTASFRGAAGLPRLPKIPRRDRLAF